MRTGGVGGGTHLIIINITITATLGVQANPSPPSVNWKTGTELAARMFSKSDSNIKLWLLILILSHIIQDKYSIFNIRVRLLTWLALPSLIIVPRAQ